MILPVDFTNKSELRKAFSYMTRIGLAPKFGSCPISHYQQAQVTAIERLERMVKNRDGNPVEIRVRDGYIECREVGTVRWRSLISLSSPKLWW